MFQSAVFANELFLKDQRQSCLTRRGWSLQEGRNLFVHGCLSIHANVDAHAVHATCHNTVDASRFSATHAKAFGLGHFAWSFALVSRVIQRDGCIWPTSRSRGLGMSAQSRKSGKISTKTFWTISGIASVDPPCAQVLAASSSFTCQQVWARSKRRAHRGKIIGHGPGPSHGNKLMQPFSDKTKDCRHS